MDQKIDNTSPEAIRARLSPDIQEYARLSEDERERYDARWKTYVERALYVLLTDGHLDQATDETLPLSVDEIGWLNRMAHFVFDRHHAFGKPTAFGLCLSGKQFETVVRGRDGGERISHFSNTLSVLARKKKMEYTEEDGRTEEPESVAPDGDSGGSQAPASEHPTFGQVIENGRRAKSARHKS
jgi:hypothetical protein